MPVTVECLLTHPVAGTQLTHVLGASRQSWRGATCVSDGHPEPGERLQLICSGAIEEPVDRLPDQSRLGNPRRGRALSQPPVALFIEIDLCTPHDVRVYIDAVQATAVAETAPSGSGGALTHYWMKPSCVR